MNQENAPHMQPMEQAGEQGSVPYPSYNEERPATEATAPNTQPPRHPLLYGTDKGNSLPILLRVPNAALSSMPYGMPYGGYPQPGYTVPAHNLPPRCKRQTSTANHRKGNRFPPTWPTTQSRRSQPRDSQATLLDTSNHRLAIHNKRFSSSPQQQTHTLCSQRRRSPTPNDAATGFGCLPGRQPFVPSFVEPATYGEDYAHTMNGGIIESVEETAPSQSFDYHHITTPARIAIYDSLKTAPRVIQVQGGPTHEYIEHIASLTYKNAKEAGGVIPYTVIREVSENFIHANFNEVVVSIFDQGNTIRFADQAQASSTKISYKNQDFPLPSSR